MKVEIIGVEKGFEPITIQLTIESKEELQELWHRTNLPMIDFKNAYDVKNRTRDFTFSFKNSGAADGFWSALNDLAGRLGIKP